MDEAQANARAAELAETSPDRLTHSWITKQLPDGTWAVVKLAIPKPTQPDQVKTVSTKPEAAKDDPRIPLEQNLPPHTILGG